MWNQSLSCFTILKNMWRRLCEWEKEGWQCTEWFQTIQENRNGKLLLSDQVTFEKGAFTVLCGPEISATWGSYACVWGSFLFFSLFPILVTVSIIFCILCYYWIFKFTNSIHYYLYVNNTTAPYAKMVLRFCIRRL